MQIDHSALYGFMQHMVNLTEDAWSEMKILLQNRLYEKKSIFISEGHISKEIAFISSGSFRYYKVIEGVEITTYFAFENEWVSSYSNFIQQSASYVTIEAMQSAEVFVLSYDDLQYLYKQYPEFERFGRKILT